MNTRSGFDDKTKTYKSLKPALSLPQPNHPLSAAEFALGLQSTSPWPTTTAFIDCCSGQRLAFPELRARVHSLSSYLHNVLHLSRNDTAFVLSSNSIQVPVLYLALLSLGVIISPSNPVNNASDISRQVELSKPVIAFATSAAAHKLPPQRMRVVMMDSPEFDSMMMTSSAGPRAAEVGVKVKQDDVAAIMYSSGTTGRFKGVALTHRNLIAVVASFYDVWRQNMLTSPPSVILSTAPYFHVIGFYTCLKSVALGQVVVVMERFELGRMLRAVGEFKVTHIVGAPPVVVRMVKNHAVVDEYDLTSLREVMCGGAPLGKDVIDMLLTKYPGISLTQGYGMTETAGAVVRMIGPEESRRWGSVGRLLGGCEAKIVDPDTTNALPPGEQGELWLRGPQVMRGYVGDDEGNSATLTSDGWLKTGDLCYIDQDGFLFVVDRLKELIKCKGYQVAPAELEQLLQSHPHIADAAVIPYPDEEAGQVPMACVVKQPHSNLDQKEIVDFIAKQVTPYKKIRRVAFISSIPKSQAGKILRKDLRKLINSKQPVSRL